MNNDPKAPKYSFTMLANKRAKIELYDQLGPRWAGMIDARMVSQSLRDAGPVDSIELRINSPGGSAFEGLAIANILKDHPAQVEVVVDGIAASAATLPLMSGDVRRVPKNALVMIHDPMTYAAGGEKEMLAAIAALQAVKKAGIALYASRSNKSEAEIATMMSTTTYMTGEEALAAGFATTMGEDLPAEKVPVKQQLLPPVQFSFDRELLPELAALPALQVVPFLEPIMADKTNPPAPSPAPPAPGTPAPAPAPAAPQQNTTPPAAPAAAPVSLTKEDLERVAADAAQKAVAGERNRGNDIVSLCQKAGCPEKAAEFIGAGKTPEEIRVQLFDSLCERNKAVGDGLSPQQSGGGDANAAYKKEYAANPHLAATMSLDDYVATRRIDDGLDKLTAPKPAAAAAK